MNCQHCGREAEPEAKFCVDCGSPLELRCTACQTPYDLGSRFCALCGRSLPEAVPSPDKELLEETERTEQAEFHEKAEKLTEPASKNMSCPRCHQTNTLDADYCYACGMPLENAIVDAPVPEASAGTASEELAGFWLRLVAYAIDNVLIAFVAFVAWGIISSGRSDGLEPQNWLALISVFYFTPLIATKATTIGKGFFGVYVVRTDGSKIGLGRALVRTLATFLSALLLGIGFFQVALREDKRALHDMVCDTKVVKRDQHPFG